MSVVPSSPAAASSGAASRKRFGVFYTPEPVASFLVESTFQEWSGQHSQFAELRILDPACGEGALLWPAYRLLCQRQRLSRPGERLDLIRRQLFGVDLDPIAVDRLRQRFRDDLTADVAPTTVDAVLRRNFRCGNAVDGHGWERPTGSGSGRFHWSEQFPEACVAGGFDVVIANPPYRRERGAKSDLDALARSPLALSHRQARMDLWHYFFHRSLDLLKPDGILTFIVNSYWTTSHAGQPLIARLQAETTPLEFVLLGTAPVFAGVGGRHLTMRLRKGITTEHCRVVTLSAAQRADVLRPELWLTLSGKVLRPPTAGHDRDMTLGATGCADTRSAFPQGTGTASGTPPFICDTGRAGDVLDETQIAREELWLGGRLNLQRLPAHSSDAGRISVNSRLTLGDIFEVRQGIAENPPRVTAQQARLNPELRAGEGVFVLTAEELARLELSPEEQRLVRPYFTAAEFTKYGNVPAPRQWLLYLTRQTAPDLAPLPRIEKHLSRFRSLLEQRRETRSGTIAWWHLHWPREARLFEQPRILAVQMVREPTFTCVKAPTYVGFSLNVIVDRPSGSTRDPSVPTLEAVAALLNSKAAAQWFDTHAKRRGVNLDITGGTLKKFPLPEMDHAACQELTRLGRLRTQTGMHSAIESEIDRVIADL